MKYLRHRIGICCFHPSIIGFCADFIRCLAKTRQPVPDSIFDGCQDHFYAGVQRSHRLFTRYIAFDRKSRGGIGERPILLL